jgi:Tfp pilus assembly protein PilX
MLRTNLSTRPFYNERGVHLVIGLVAILLVALTAWNVYRVVTLSRANTELSSRVNQDHAEAEQLRKMATDIRRRINQEELQQVVSAAREANSLIDQRTFSWTAFFNRIESTMPPDVMLTSVRPSIKDGVTRVAMVVIGRRAEDIDEFIEKLEATGSFDDILPSQTEYTDDGMRRVLVESVYTGEAPAVEPAPDAPASPAPKPSTPKQQKGVTP